DQAPTPVITGAPAYVTSNTPYDITVDFGEVVSGFVLSDLLVSNGTGSNLVDNTDGTYTITITPDGSGDITYDINAGVATDAAGNSNNAATQVTTIYDASAPTVDIQDEPAIVNSTSPYTVTFSFNEDVTGFTLADIAVVNGAAGNFVTVNDSTYTADITPNGTGDITIDVAAGVAQDAAGNDNTAATQAVTEYDVTAPTPVISGAPTIVNSTTPYVVTIDFGEEVSGFVAGDITVGNGAVTSFTDNGDGTFSVEITPSGAGDITLDVAAGVAQDAAGNSNNAATQVTTTYDDDAPVLSIENAPDYVNSTTPYTVTFQFSEDVSGFDVSDIGVTNGSASNFIVVDANTYTADITPSGAGNIVVNVPTSAAQDAAGNGSTADSATTIYDTSAPTPAITGAPTVVNNTDPYTVTIDFQEAVTGFVLGDVSVTNGSASGLVDNGDGTFDVTITPSGAGDISIDVAAGVAQDLAGNDNLAATTVTTTYDTDAPTVDIQGEPAIVNSVATYTVTIQFSEDVTGFDISDILVGNGSKGNFQTTNASTYTVDITPDGTGDITIDVPAASAQDASTNDNAAAIQAVTKYDATSPTVAILNAPDSVNSTNPYQVTIQFDEKVSGLLESEVSVTNGAVSNLVKTNDSTYTADITPDGTGDISIDIAGGAAQDEAGNDNTVATTVTTVYDITQPDVTISNQPDTVNSTASYVVNFQFTENVSGFSIADIDVGNGTASNFVKTDGQNYSATITPSGAGDITIDVAAGVAQDAAGNTNTAATQVETIYDADRPTARIENAPAVVGNASPYDV
ncbi:beta strand repeat-containing protein, partial [Marinoscillum furvescens]